MNSTVRKCVSVQLIRNRKVTEFEPKGGCLNIAEENHEILVAGFSPKGHAAGYFAEAQFQFVKVSNVSPLSLYKGNKERPRS